MAESFGEKWENEFRYITGEDPPQKHFYRDIYDEESEKASGTMIQHYCSSHTDIQKRVT